MSIASVTARMPSLPIQAAEDAVRALSGFSYGYWFSPGVPGDKVT
ncbi:MULTISPECIES: hypothetical protein [Chromohalobacter]|uniref:Uncharacterized protein n=1 Tax=Chromohalobacter sarecensis TaxID=245294 RepID=A0ABV9D094_9GAMM|nr:MULTISPECIES: hypothetical protein [Chromohalobacter]